MSDNLSSNSKENTNFWSKMFAQNNHQTLLEDMGGLSGAPSIQSKVPDTLPCQSKQSELPTTSKKSTKPNHVWMDLFADLDPLANPQAFDMKLSEGRMNSEQT